MSRFWAGASSSDEDSSSDDSSSYSSSDSEDNNRNTNKWADLSDSDSSDDEARVVKSGKERALETFDKHIGNIRNGMKNRDYYAIQTEFDELAKAMAKNPSNRFSCGAELAIALRNCVRILCADLLFTFLHCFIPDLVAMQQN